MRLILHHCRQQLSLGLLLPLPYERFFSLFYCSTLVGLVWNGASYLFSFREIYITLLILYMRKLVALECYPVTLYMNVHEVSKATWYYKEYCVKPPSLAQHTSDFLPFSLLRETLPTVLADSFLPWYLPPYLRQHTADASLFSFK